MPAEWPAAVPFFRAVDAMTRSGPQGAVIRTSMDAGPDKVRRRTTAAPMRFSGRTSFLSLEDLNIFEMWFLDLIGSGALPFTATDPMTCQPRTYRFVGDYSVVRAGAKFQVSAELEILP